MQRPAFSTIVIRGVAVTAAFVVLLAHCPVYPAGAQRRPRRVIQLDEPSFEDPPAEAEWLVGAVDSCPGRQLARLGGVSSAEGCPALASVTSRLSEEAIARVGQSSESLRVATALFYASSDDQLLHYAYRIYREAASRPALRPYALYAAARSAFRLMRYRECISLIGELLSATREPETRAAATRLYARALSFEDWDEDGIADDDFGVPRVQPPNLPDAEWAFPVAIETLRALARVREPEFAAMLEAVEQRWPERADESALALDEVAATGLRHRWTSDTPAMRASREARLAERLFTAMTRCRARGAECESTMAERTVQLIIERLDRCRAVVESGEDRRDYRAPQRLDECAVTLEWAARLIAFHPIPSLARDLASLGEWLPGARERVEHANRSFGRALLDPRPEPTTIAPPEPQAAYPGAYNPRAIQHAVDRAALANCARAQGAFLGLEIVVAESGEMESITTTRAGPVASCVREVIARTRLRFGPEGGAYRLTGTVVLLP